MPAGPRRRASAAAAALLPALLLTGCANLGSLGCDEIAEQAKRASQDRGLKIVAIANAREMSRDESDVRCAADATWSDGANMTVYVRAYEESGTRMIAYQSTPFDRRGGQAQ